MSDSKSVFNQLNTINYETKSNQGRRYIAWNTLWAGICKIFPDATYEFHCDINGCPFFNSPIGLFVKVSVTINGITHTMIRPVYNKAMKSMRVESYEYVTTKGTKQVAGANADDVNDALMRCFAKAMAMHGNGLFVYEDKQYADLELIDSSQISEISNLIAKHNLRLSDLLNVYGINRLSELASFNFENALEWINANKVS